MVNIVKALVFPVVMYGCENWTIKKAECWRFYAFKLWCWRRLLRVPRTTRRLNQSIVKEISSEHSLKGLILKLKLQFFATPWTEAHQASLSITNSQSLLKLMSIELVMPSNHLILSSPSPPAFNLSRHQGLFQWVNSSHQLAKVVEFQLQHHSFQWIFRTDFLYDWLVESPCSPSGSQESYPTPQFKCMNSSVLSCLYSPILTSIHDYWKKL